MRVLLVDHEDSFLWNLVQDLGSRVGRWPAVVSHRADWSQVEEELARGPELVVLGPGPGHPADPDDVGVSPRILRALDPTVPVFGVCLGLQVVLHEFGGRVREAAEVVHGKSRSILHDGGGPFEGLPQGTAMMRYHSWVADRDRIPPCLRVRATTEEGEIMALGHRDRPVEAVQFHPESVGSADGGRLLDNVLRWASRPRGRALERSAQTRL